MLPYTDWQGLKVGADASTTPEATGEYGFGLKETFRLLIDHRAVDFLHPDVAVCGGLLEFRRIAEYGHLHGIPVAVDSCNGERPFTWPLTLNFVPLEYHGSAVPSGPI
jgi:L-alanine-DL-glutamate epimerase-like enolase superfamily enzyme